MNQTIVNQFSDDIALCQHAKELDEFANKLQFLLFTYKIPEPLENIGLRIEGDGTPHGLQATAHGFAFHGRFEHVWLKQKGTRDLGGRVQFFRENIDGKDSGEVIYQLLFNRQGLVKLAGEQFFSYTLLGNEDDTQHLCRSLALALTRAIHSQLDVIDLDN